MIDNEIVLAFNNSFNRTKDIIAHAVENGKSLLKNRGIKNTESTMLIESAQSLHTTAHRFMSSIEIYNENRDTGTLDQLAATNNYLEAAFVAFNELVERNTSPRAITAKRMVVSLTPLLPVAVYFSYKALRRPISINPTIDQQMLETSMLHKAYASSLRDARENILFMLNDAY